MKLFFVLFCLFSLTSSLLCSLFRLLWLQAAYGVGSAQLVTDNFWLMTRLAVTYFCHNVVDRDTLMVSILNCCISADRFIEICSSISLISLFIAVD